MRQIDSVTVRQLGSETERQLDIDGGREKELGILKKLHIIKQKLLYFSDEKYWYYWNFGGKYRSACNNYS